MTAPSPFFPPGEQGGFPECPSLWPILLKSPLYTEVWGHYWTWVYHIPWNSSILCSITYWGNQILSSSEGSGHDSSGTHCLLLQPGAIIADIHSCYASPLSLVETLPNSLLKHTFVFLFTTAGTGNNCLFTVTYCSAPKQNLLRPKPSNLIFNLSPRVEQIIGQAIRVKWKLSRARDWSHWYRISLACVRHWLSPLT